MSRPENGSEGLTDSSTVISETDLQVREVRLVKFEGVELFDRKARESVEFFDDTFVDVGDPE